MGMFGFSCVLAAFWLWMGKEQKPSYQTGFIAARLGDFRNWLLPMGLFCIGISLPAAIVTWDGEHPSLNAEMLLCLRASARCILFLIGFYCLERLRARRSQRRL